jgi:hypothetical protein
MLEDNTNMAEWVQSKITLAADYISTVADYMQSEVNEAISVKKANYSWGKMVTVHHGASTSYPLHPEHQKAIAKLGDGEKTSFKDETNTHVVARRDGDNVHLTQPKKSSTMTTVAHSHFNEEIEQVTELKKSTLGSYVKKAADSATMHAYGAGGESQRHAGEPVSKRPDTYGADRKVALKRLKGIDKATERLTKEATENPCWDGYKMLGMKDKGGKKVPNCIPEEQHYCAKHVYSNMFGEGEVVEGLHAEPDEEGNVEWYAVQFNEGIKKVFTENLEVMIAEFHGNHTKKKPKR